MYMDTLICSIIVGDRFISMSSATSLVNPVLTRAEGLLDIQSNNVLTRIDFASMSYVREYLYVGSNPALTFASMPRLSQVQGHIRICKNAPSFVIPNVASGTAAPPGLMSVQFKGQASCIISNGSTSPCPSVTCP